LVFIASPTNKKSRSNKYQTQPTNKKSRSNKYQTQPTNKKHKQYLGNNTNIGVMKN
jgi:hypothetical protein